VKTLHTLEEKFDLSCRQVFSSSCRKVTSDAGTVVATVAVNVSDYNKCGTFMNAASKPPPLAYISWEGGEVFTGGGEETSRTGHPWSDSPSSAAAAHGRQHYCAAEPSGHCPTSAHWRETRE